MKNAIEYLEVFKSYKIDCGRCCGLCCTALCFVKTEGFPENKPAGRPCVQLAEDFTCNIHADLSRLKMRGCIGYDCFGAGNYVTSQLYSGESWHSQPTRANEMFAVFQTVFSLFQIRYYLEWVRLIPDASDLQPTAEALIAENVGLCSQSPEALAALEIDSYRSRANAILKEACGRAKKEREIKKGAAALPKVDSQMLGKSFKNQDLSGLDLSMRMMIGASFEGCSFSGTALLGADTRDADFSNADLSMALFLTQGQVNAAKGNRRTKLPPHLEAPPTWQ